MEFISVGKERLMETGNGVHKPFLTGIRGRKVLIAKIRKGVYMVQEVDINNFQTEVLESNKLTIVDFFANWCGPCRKLSPILEEVESELSEKVKFTKINTDENISAAQKYQVSGLPTLLVFKNGEIVERMVGLMPKSSIITNIEKHI